MSAISSTLLAEFEKRAAKNPQLSFQLIVTLHPGFKTAEFAVNGFQIEHRMDAVGIVSGRAVLASVRTLSKHRAVKSIEEDGEVRALPSR